MLALLENFSSIILEEKNYKITLSLENDFYYPFQRTLGNVQFIKITEPVVN